MFTYLNKFDTKRFFINLITLTALRMAVLGALRFALIRPSQGATDASNIEVLVFLFPHVFVLSFLVALFISISRSLHRFDDSVGLEEYMRGLLSRINRVGLRYRQ